MAIPTSRTKEPATIKIRNELCNGCALCVSVCNDFCLILENGKAQKSETSFFGCYACGHCMAICQTGAIEISGREISPDDLFDLPDKKKTISYTQLLTLLQHRRSIRKFKNLPVESDVVEKILTASKSAPMGLPPSDVNVLVLNGKEKTRAFAKDFSNYLKGMKFMTSRFLLALMRPFWGKVNDEIFKGFVSPLFKVYTDEMDKGNNYITYDAPLALYFYGSPYSDPADSIIAATYAMITAETLGLGSCMIGGIHPLIQNGRKARLFRKKNKIMSKSREGLFIVFGYPEVKFRKGIKRTFASIQMI